MSSLISQSSAFAQAVPIARAALRFPDTAMRVILDAAIDHLGAQSASAFHATKHGVAMLSHSGEGHDGPQGPGTAGHADFVRELIEGSEMTRPEWGRADWYVHTGRPIQSDGYIIAIFAGAGDGPAHDPASIRDELCLFMTLAALAHQNDRLESELDDLRETRAILGATFRHDLRHPLQGITAAAALLAENSLNEAERVEMLGMICSESENLNSMIDATFADSVMHENVPPKLECVEISDLAASVAASGRSAHAGRVLLDVEPCSMTTDPERLARAVRNLVDNAMKYAPTDDTVDVFGRISGDDYVLQVIDGGPGVEPHLVHRLFTPFFRDANRIDSTGLGLTSVARLVESLGGRVSYSKRERTVFEIEVPIDSSLKGIHATH